MAAKRRCPGAASRELLGAIGECWAGRHPDGGH